MTEGMLKMMGVFSELERNIISQRVKSGMENAKSKGKAIGRPAVTADDIPAIMETGVSGIALSGTILQAEDPEKETKKIIDLLNKYRKA